MPLKALAAVKSHVALAVFSALLLLAGGGSAVALAASQGHLGGGGPQQVTNHGSSHGDNGKSNGRAHAEGKLTACDASTATAGTISVTDAQGQVHVFSIAATTRFNGDIHASAASSSSSSSNGAAPAFGLKDLCALVNKVKVQAQAQATSSGSTTTFTAVKITVQGADGADNGPDPTDIPERTPDASGD